MTRPTIRYGDEGSFVEQVQSCLELEPLDGDFGSITKEGVEKFQRRKRLDADGVVGPDTWAALEDEYELPPYPPQLLAPLDDETFQSIMLIAERSQIARYQWKDRGQAPLAYTQGMCMVFADMVRRHEAGDTTAKECAKADTRNDDKDAISWYSDRFDELGMDNSQSGLDTLRHLFVLMLGLGMRESSGKYCEGRDMSASNVSSDTAEAGLFQMSWNASSCSQEMQLLMDQYSEATSEQCALDVFNKDVTCSSSDYESYGSGDGYKYQEMAKDCPQFCAETAAVGLRNLRQHWGPINRYEAEVRQESDDLLKAVQLLVLPPLVA